MYLAILHYKAPREEVERYRSDHIAFLKKDYERSDFIVSGKMSLNFISTHLSGEKIFSMKQGL
jgi:uncharacterized protein YciI